MTRLYVIVRSELAGGALLAHVAHAAREAAGPRPTEDERVSILMASKAQMERVAQDLRDAGFDFKACIQTDGPMAGSTPSIGCALEEEQREHLPQSLKELKVWRAPKSSLTSESCSTSA